MANNKKFKECVGKFILKFYLVIFIAGVGLIAFQLAMKIFFPNPLFINIPLASYSKKDTTAILATLEKTVNKNDNIDIEKTFENVEKHIEYLISLVEIQKQEVERIKSKNDITSSLVTLFGLIGFIIALGAALNFFERFKERKVDLINEFNSLSKELNYKNKKQLEILKTQLNNFKSLSKELSDENKKQIETLKANSIKEYNSLIKELSDENKKQIETLKANSKKEISFVVNQFDRDVKEAFNQFNRDLKKVRLYPFYQQGVSFYNRKKYNEAISQFLIAYKSNYRKPHTCFYLGSSYKELYLLDATQENKANALKYLKEALELNKEELRLNQIQREIDEINATD